MQASFSDSKLDTWMGGEYCYLCGGDGEPECPAPEVPPRSERGTLA